MLIILEPDLGVIYCLAGTEKSVLPEATDFLLQDISGWS